MLCPRKAYVEPGSLAFRWREDTDTSLQPHYWPLKHHQDREQGEENLAGCPVASQREIRSCYNEVLARLEGRAVGNLYNVYGVLKIGAESNANREARNTSVNYGTRASVYKKFHALGGTEIRLHIICIQ